jgi:hypothetical protein
VAFGGERARRLFDAEAVAKGLIPIVATCFLNGPHPCAILSFRSQSRQRRVSSAALAKGHGPIADCCSLNSLPERDNGLNICTATALNRPICFDRRRQ